jgi:glycosyltransferase involved in cell wall biosynthesis
MALITMLDAPLVTPPVVLLLGPNRSAVSGVSTHLDLLFSSGLGQQFRLKHFQVGSEGRKENHLDRLVRLLISPLMLAATLLAERADMVHINTSLNRRAYWRDLVYMVVTRLSGTRVIYQIHGGDLPQKFARHNRVLSAMLRVSLSLADVIVVLAQSELEAYREFIPGADIRVIPNAVDCAPYVELQREHRDTQAALQLIYVGRLSLQKGLYEALSGLHLARADGVAANLVIAGSGPDEAILRQLVERLKLTNTVKFAGPVFGEDKRALLAEADVLLFPTYAEGLPYALLESMAAGVPAITTRVGAIPDVVIDGVHGIFVTPRTINGIARGITKLAGDRKLLAQMSAACRSRIATRYSVQRFAGEFSRLYSSIGTNGRNSDIAGLGDKSL